jgi:sec-independent protein translocase protein TatC
MEENDNPNSEHKANKMSFLEHLEVLRAILVRSIIVICVFTVIAFAYSDYIFDKIILAPTHIHDFPTYKVMCQASQWLGPVAPWLGVDPTAGCIESFPFQLTTNTMGGDFMAVMLVAFIFGCIASAPYLFWQIWSFLRPALREKEVKKAKGFVFWTSILFFLGVAFGYYVISPLSISFLGTFSAHKDIVKLPTLNSYMGVLASTTLATGAAFELPIVIYLLSSIGLITPEFLRKFRKHSVVVILIVAAIITPPDVFSQIVVSIPLYLLYEISILLSAMVQKRKEKAA